MFDYSGLPKYKNGDFVVGAAKITGMTALSVPSIKGCMRLHFSDVDKQADMLGDWMASHKPEVGGWFVLMSEKACKYVPDAEFQQGYTPKEN